jgi:hypothetical protein
MLVLLVVLLGVAAIQGSPRDSYLDAYEESHGTTAKSDREYSEPYPYPPSQPGYQYGPPSGPPKYTYGPPAPSHKYYSRLNCTKSWFSTSVAVMGLQYLCMVPLHPSTGCPTGC